MDWAGCGRPARTLRRASLFPWHSDSKWSSGLNLSRKPFSTGPKRRSCSLLEPYNTGTNRVYQNKIGTRYLLKIISKSRKIFLFHLWHEKSSALTEVIHPRTPEKHLPMIFRNSFPKVWSAFVLRSSTPTPLRPRLPSRMVFISSVIRAPQKIWTRGCLTEQEQGVTVHVSTVIEFLGLEVCSRFYRVHFLTVFFPD